MVISWSITYYVHLQASFFILVRPVSKNLYRRINKVVVELLWLELVWLFDWWAGIKVELYTDSKTLELMGKEHALLICNHRSDIDWLVGWVLAQRSSCLGSALAVMKKSAKFLPVVGWSMWFSDYVFLERSWARDEITLKLGLQWLNDFPIPFWLALFVEGTRFTTAKLQAAQEYAAKNGLPIPKNVLVPRTKGFVSAVQNIRTFVPAIYNCTVVIPKQQPPPTMLRILKGQPSLVHVHIKRQLMEELPETEHDIAQWCKDTFVAKDALLEEHLAANTFTDVEYQEIGRPKTSLFVVTTWTCLLTMGAVKFLQLTSFLSSWKGLALLGVLLILVMILMHMLVIFSQSEPSIPVKVPMAEPIKEKLLLDELKI